MDGIAGFILAAFALSASPGPNTLSLAAVGSSYGWSHGLRFLLGINTGMAVIVGLAATGISTAVLGAPFVAPAITVLAMFYFLWLAWRIATAPVSQFEERTETQPRWRDGMTICLFNPKAYATIGAMIAGPSLIQSEPTTDALVKSALLMGLILFVTNIWLLAGGAMRSWTRPKYRRRLNIAFAILLLISVGLSAASGLS